MAIRKPLIIDKTDGAVKELPVGDHIQEASIGFSGLNNTGGSIIKGTPVNKTSTTSEVDVADATDNTLHCVGFAGLEILNTESGEIQVADTISCDWTVINLAGTNLTAGDIYYLSTTAGKITNDVSAFVGGNVIQKLGIAVSTTDLLIEIDRPILLS